MTTLNINNQTYQLNLFVPLIKEGQINDHYGLYHASFNGEAYLILKNDDSYQVENVKQSTLLDTLREETFMLRRKVERSIYNQANENLDKVQNLVGKWQEEIKSVEIEKIEFNRNKLEQQRQVHRQVFYSELENWLDKAQCIEHVFYENHPSTDTITYGIYQSKIDNTIKIISTMTNHTQSEKSEINLEEFKECIKSIKDKNIEKSLLSMLDVYQTITEEKPMNEKINHFRQTSASNKTLKAKV